MPKVEIWLQQPGAAGHIITVEEAVVMNHLEKIREVVVTLPPKLDPKKVFVTHGAFGPLKFVLEKVVSKRDELHINVGDRPLKIVIAIYEALQVLGVEPEQSHVEGHIIGHVSHNKLSSEDIEVTQRMFGHLGPSSRCWTSLVYQLGWYFAKDHYDDTEAEGIARTLERYPTLYVAVQETQDELVAKHKANEAEKTARLEHRERYQAKGKDQHRNAKSQQGSSRYISGRGDAATSTATSATKARQGFKLGPLTVDSMRSEAGTGTNAPTVATSDELSLQASTGWVQQLSIQDTVSTPTASFKSVELYVQSTEGELLGSTTKRVRARFGIEDVKVNVVIDKSKTTAEEFNRKMQQWIDEIADVFDEAVNPG